MKSLMQHGASRAAWLPLLLASGACNVDLPLGDLTADDAALIDDGEGAGTGATAAPHEGSTATVLPAPALTIGLGDGVNGPDMLGAAGDMDGDGFDDLAVLSVDEATGVQYVHLRYGGRRPSAGAEAFSFDESGAKLRLSSGYADQILVRGLYAAGDVDDDGFADLFVATAVCNGPRPGDGGYLIYGGPERLDGILDIASVGAQFSPPVRAGDGSGCEDYSFAAPGDIDGDGFADLAFAHRGPFEGQLTWPTASGEGGIYVFYGKAERFPASTSWSDAAAHLSSALSGDVMRDADYMSVAAAGDLDGDGRAELLVNYSASRFDQRQALILVPGSSERLAGDIDLLAITPNIPGASPIDGTRAVGDLDADGFDELLISLPDQPGPSLFYGAPDLLSSPLDAEHATATFDRGLGVFPAGDLDGDGDADLVAMRYVSNVVYTVVGFDMAVWRGSRTRPSGNIRFGADPTLAGARLYPDDRDRYAQYAAPVGDLDGDGSADVLTVSLRQYEDGFFDASPMLHIHYGEPGAGGALDGPY